MQFGLDSAGLTVGQMRSKGCLNSKPVTKNPDALEVGRLGCAFIRLGVDAAAVLVIFLNGFFGLCIQRLEERTMEISGSIQK